jgi:hypothetical protein
MCADPHLHGPAGQCAQRCSGAAQRCLVLCYTFQAVVGTQTSSDKKSEAEVGEEEAESDDEFCDRTKASGPQTKRPQLTLSFCASNCGWNRAVRADRGRGGPSTHAGKRRMLLSIRDPRLAGGGQKPR